MVQNLGTSSYRLPSGVARPRASSPLARAVHWLERATGIDPAGEHLFRRRMQAYVTLGRFQAVHHCYAELGEQLRLVGDRPEQRTTRLYRRPIAQAD